MGAAVQAGVLAGEVKDGRVLLRMLWAMGSETYVPTHCQDLVLLDVVPLSLSVAGSTAEARTILQLSRSCAEQLARAQATHDGLSSVFLPRNTRVPAKKTKAGSLAGCDFVALRLCCEKGLMLAHVFAVRS